ncbi:MAG: hypothetical protein M1355_00320 [Patescibacteria group bacterium]|nr:hypothetical protein [Patescibacteria group bacterium]
MLNAKIKGVIKTIEKDEAIIDLGEREIAWPKENLKQGLKAGDPVVLALFTEEEDTKNTEELAKALLNEVLRKE